MQIKRILLVLFLFVLVFTAEPRAAGTKSIDQVLNKAVLDEQDKKIIDNFMAASVANLINASDLSSIASLRKAILTKKSSQGQYAQQFSDSAYKYLSEALPKAASLESTERRDIILINLLLLTEELQENRMRLLAVNYIEAESMAVRYEAVRCLNNQELIKKLNSGQRTDTDAAVNIISRMQNVVEKSCPQIIAMIAQISGGINMPAAQAMLIKAADVRIRQYSDWTVQNEFSDITILKMLESKITSGISTGDAEATDSSGSAFALRFAQLYSYVIQRYIKGGNFLSDIQKQQLVSVIIETEQKSIFNILGMQSSSMKQAIAKKDLQALQKEHDNLLGSGSSRGLLPSRLGFNYGSTGNAPTSLPDPSK
jgi:hypothetical protein